MELAADQNEEQYSCSSSSQMSGQQLLLPAERQSSIEKEPRTLNINQLDFAREVAEYVVNTRTTDEALQIFTQGLVPVTRACRDDGLILMGDQLDHPQTDESWNCVVRDVASAPF